MQANDYLYSVINTYQPNINAPMAAYLELSPIIQEWAGEHLLEIKPTGSYAKGTAISLASDVDLFISLSPELSSTEWPLSKIYDSLFKKMQDAGYTPRKQNVSIGVTVQGHKVDLVPGRKQGHQTTDHSLYVRKQGTWKKTNVDTHVNHVKLWQRHNETKLLKVWRHRQNIELPSFFIELFIINKLNGRNYYELTDNTVYLLQQLRDDINCYLQDPANSSNNLSDDLTADEKKRVVAAATNSLQADDWNDIIW